MGSVEANIETSILVGFGTLGGHSHPSAGARVFELVGDVAPVACLVSLRRTDASCILPLRRGTSVVGRSGTLQYVSEPKALRGIVEGAQWVVTCMPGTSEIRDASSTDGSVVVRRTDCGLVPLELPVLQRSPVGLRIGWDGTSQHRESVRIQTGDVVVNVYGAFVFVEQELLPRTSD